jgi:hypothetical protein
VTNVLAVVAVEHGHPVAEVVGNETDDRAQHPDEPTAGHQGRLRRADARRRVTATAPVEDLGRGQ